MTDLNRTMDDIVADADLVEELRTALDEAHASLYEARKRLEYNCWIAARVHRSLLPSIVTHPGINVDVRYQPVDTLGGDYCQVRFPNPSVCYITLCHVTGPGTAAALLATRISSEVRHLILDKVGPGEIVRSLNSFVYDYFHDLRLRVTFMAARIDLEQGSVAHSGGGHPGAMLLRPGKGLVHQLSSQTACIGAARSIRVPHPEHRQPVEAGDRLLFFTEGITQTVNASGRELGQSGLAQFAVKAIDTDLFAMADAILEQVARFRYGPARDDRTLLVAEIKERPGSQREASPKSPLARWS